MTIPAPHSIRRMTLSVPTMRTALTLVFLALLIPLLSGCGAGGLGEQIYTAAVDDPAAFSIVRHDPPEGKQWIMCSGGRNEGRMRSIGRGGDDIVLSSGHELTVHSDAVSDVTDFIFVEPRSPQIIVYASAPGRFSGSGVALLLSGENRPGCTVPSDAVIARIRPDQPAEEILSQPGPRANTIQTAEPLVELSSYALAR